MTPLERYESNPILSPTPDLPWANKKVYNAAVAFESGVFHMLFRAVGDDWISRLGYARSSNGISFDVDPQPVMSPSTAWEAKGCEDPRVTRIDGRLYVAYTAWDGGTACQAMADVENWRTFPYRRLALPNWRLGHWQKLARGPRGWSKAGALFSCRLNGRYGMLFGDSDIWYASSDDLVSWTGHAVPVLSPRGGYFDEGYVEMGPPPLRTDEGWLVLYHGIDKKEDEPGAFRVYRLGAALLDLDNPFEILWRCDEPLLEPAKSYEAVGLIDIITERFESLRNLTSTDLEEKARAGILASAIFCCGAVEVEGRLWIYYSGSDTVLCLATTTVDDVLSRSES